MEESHFKVISDTKEKVYDDVKETFANLKQLREEKKDLSDLIQEHKKYETLDIKGLDDHIQCMKDLDEKIYLAEMAYSRALNSELSCNLEVLSIHLINLNDNISDMKLSNFKSARQQRWLTGGIIFIGSISLIGSIITLLKTFGKI